MNKQILWNATINVFFIWVKIIVIGFLIAFPFIMVMITACVRFYLIYVLYIIGCIMIGFECKKLLKKAPENKESDK